jgi:hypothetical protein
MDQVPSEIANRTISAATLVPVVFYHLDFDSSANSAQIFNLPALSTNGLLSGVTLTGDVDGPEVQSRLSLAEDLRQSTVNTWRLPNKPTGRSIRPEKSRWTSREQDTKTAITTASGAVSRTQLGMGVTRSLFVDKTDWDRLQSTSSVHGTVKIYSLA